MTTNHDLAAATRANPLAPFPLQRPGRLARVLFKAGAWAYREPLARLLGAYAMLLFTTTGRV
jgi:hypothetical protein